MNDKEQSPGWQGLGEPHHMNLEAACMLVSQAFNETCYLVGTAAVQRDFRDVDVRIIMNDDKFDTLFGNTGGGTRAFWTLVSVSVSAWLKQCTGLPVDFQVVRRSAVQEADWDKVRWPLNILDFDETRPEWSKTRGT